MGLRRTSRLAVVTLDVTLRKLVRMRLVTQHEDERFRLTARGRRVAKEMRTGQHVTESDR